MRAPGRRGIIFGVSFAVKGSLAFVFFGSVDLVNSIDLTASLVDGDGGLIASLPYLPAISAFHWLGGLLSVHTPLPLAFTYKLFPVLFDSFLAVLVYDFARLRGASNPYSLGLLYALSPVAILINSFHGQWDSIFLYFLVLAVFVREAAPLNIATAVRFGAVMGLSILVKPVAVILAPFLLLPAGEGGWSSYSKDKAFYQLNAAAAGSTVAVLAVFILVFQFLLADTGRTVLHIFLYANAGYPIAGLPFAGPLAEIGLLQSRLWILLPVLGLAVFFLNRRIGYVESVGVLFLAIVGLGGFSPQYLIWPLALLLIIGRVRWAALFSACASLYLILFYLSPTAAHKAWENSGTFASLGSMAWLMPPENLGQMDLQPWISALGNYALPAVSLACGVTIIIQSIRVKTGPTAFAQIPFPFWPFALFAGCLSLLWITHLTGWSFAFADALPGKIADYAVTPEGRYFNASGGGSSVFSILTWLGTGLILWCLAAWRAGSPASEPAR